MAVEEKRDRERARGREFFIPSTSFIMNQMDAIDKTGDQRDA